MGDHIGHLEEHKKPYNIMGFQEFCGKLSVRELWVSEWVSCDFVEFWGAYAPKNEDSLKNEDNLKNENNLKNKDDLKKIICPLPT